MGAGLSELMRTVEGLLREQRALETQWIGKHVRLRAPFGQVPGKGTLLLPGGKVGIVVRVRLLNEAPLVVRFPGLAIDAAPLPYTLEVASRTAVRTVRAPKGCARARSVVWLFSSSWAM